MMFECSVLRKTDTTVSYFLCISHCIEDIAAPASACKKGYHMSYRKVQVKVWVCCVIPTHTDLTKPSSSTTLEVSLIEGTRAAGHRRIALSSKAKNRKSERNMARPCSPARILFFV